MNYNKDEVEKLCSTSYFVFDLCQFIDTLTIFVVVVVFLELYIYIPKMSTKMKCFNLRTASRTSRMGLQIRVV